VVFFVYCCIYYNNRIIMVNLIKEELNKMKYLFGYQRGIVVSEQAEVTEDDPFEEQSPYNWQGRKKGMLNFAGDSNFNAVNVGYGKKRYGVTAGTSIPRIIGGGTESVAQTPPEKKTIPILTSLNLTDSAFPYPDNMVQAKFESFPEAKAQYDKFIQNIIDFLKSAHMSQMGTLTIQGTADAARPTYDIPKGYSKLDHPGTLYNGLKNPSEMNQYLADTRAKELGNLIVQDVMDKTGGINISKNIIYKPGINYYGQQGKRGFDYKSVTVVPSQTTIDIPKPDVVVKDEPGSISSTATVKPAEAKKEYLDLSKWGGPKLEATRLPNGSIAVKRSDVTSVKGLFTGDGKGIMGYKTAGNFLNKKEVFGEIKGNTFIADGMSFGEIVEASFENRTYDTRVDSSTKFVTDSRPVIVKEGNGVLIIEYMSFAFMSYE
jgi:hypothetical protein